MNEYMFARYSSIASNAIAEIVHFVYAEGMERLASDIQAAAPVEGFPYFLLSTPLFYISCAPYSYIRLTSLCPRTSYFSGSESKLWPMVLRAHSACGAIIVESFNTWTVPTELHAEVYSYLFHYFTHILTCK